MKKVINNNENVIPEMIDGIVDAFGDF
ncbi:hypothetical protein J416_13621, partial [Gracilibacillus halophilus YIM-C55.5]